MMPAYTGPERRARQMPVAQERRKPGRPRLADGEDSISLNLRLPVGMYDAACKRAHVDGETLSYVIRDALARFLSRDHDQNRSIL